MTFFTFWIISLCLAIPLMCFATWWDRRKDPHDTITVGDILLGVFLGLCPGVNTIVAIVLIGWLIFDVAPKIVVFGPRKKGV